MKIGLQNFKENSDKFISLYQQYIHKIKQIVHDDNLFEELKNFFLNYSFLKSEANFIYWEGSSGVTIKDTAFFLNCKSRGYKYFEQLYLQNDKQLIINLSDRIYYLGDAFSQAANLDDDNYSEEHISSKVFEIISKIKENLPKAKQNLCDLVKILWPNNAEQLLKDVLLGDILVDQDRLIKSSILEMLKELDLSDYTLQESKVRQENEIKSLKDQLTKSQESNSQKATESFSKLYQKVKDELEKEISPFSLFLKNFKKDVLLFQAESKKYASIFRDQITQSFQKITQFKNLKDNSRKLFAWLGKAIWKLIILTVKLNVKFLEHLKNFLGSFISLKGKIFALRLLLYVIPIVIFTFHFCQFFETNCGACKLIPSPRSNLVETKKDFVANSVNYEKKNSKNDLNSYLYFHLALITVFLVVFQQMRSAIKDLNIKKNLFEIYRHRVLVADNFPLFQNGATEKESKNQVIKSAVSALFENEPSIYENPTPPKAFDIKVGGN